jgi:pyruvate kinase
VGTWNAYSLVTPNLHSDVKVGNKIMIDDGKLEVRVISIERNHDVRVEVTMGGNISSKKGY